LIGYSPSLLQVAQASTDQYTIDDSDPGSTDDIRNLTTELIPPARQSNESASDKVLDIVATLCDGKMEMDSRGVAVRDGSDTTSQPQARMSDVFQSPHLTATIATSSSLSESGDDRERPEQMAEVVDADQEWEICNIVGKEDVDGVVHYLVEWNPTLVPKYVLKNAKEMVNKFEARLRAQARQEKGRGRLLQSMVGQRTMLEAQAIKGTQ
jgi:hypothetical protein